MVGAIDVDAHALLKRTNTEQRTGMGMWNGGRTALMSGTTPLREGSNNDGILADRSEVHEASVRMPDECSFVLRRSHQRGTLRR